MTRFTSNADNKALSEMRKKTVDERLASATALRKKYAGHVPVILCFDTRQFPARLRDRLITSGDDTASLFKAIVQRNIAAAVKDAQAELEKLRLAAAASSASKQDRDAFETAEAAVRTMLKPEEAVFYFVERRNDVEGGGTFRECDLLDSQKLFSRIDAEYRQPDGLVWIRMTKEATFGGNCGAM